MRQKQLLALLLIVVLLVVGLMPASAANSVTQIRGNFTCPSGMTSFKVDPPVSGTYDLGYGNWVTVTFTGNTVSWTSNVSMDYFAIKAGTDSVVKHYDPEAFSDSGLHGAFNSRNGQYYGFSHVSFCYDFELTVQKTAQTQFTRTFNWDISKSVDPEVLDMFVGDSGEVMYTVDVTRTGFTDSDWQVDGTISIHNPAPWAATVTGVSDSITGVGAISVSCPVSFPYQLAAGADLVCTYSTGLPDGTNRTNNAAVTTSGSVGGGSATAAVNFGDPTTVVNDSVNVDDTNGQSWQFNDTGSVSYSRTFTCDNDQDQHGNTATIRETGQWDDANVTVNCYTPGVRKDAFPTYIREYSWDISKSVDQNAFDMEDGQSGTANYTVTVHQYVSDYGWSVSGTIYVTNPHPYQSLDVSVGDVISGGIGATLDCGGFMSVPPSSVGSCNYSASLPDGSARTNTATITMGNGMSFSASVDFGFGDPTFVSGYQLVNVNDSVMGALGGASGDATFNYSRTFTCGQDAGGHPNTATIVETGQSASANVDVTCHQPPPAFWCSPGYWRQEQHFDSWPVSLDTTYNTVIDPDLDGNPTLLDVLNNPQVYGGDAFNAVADFLSGAAGLNPDGSRIENCPLN